MLNFWSAKPIAAHQAVQTFFETVQQLLDAISRSAIPVDETEYNDFRKDLQKMSERMSLENPSETLVTVGSVGRALEEYNGRVGRAVRQYQVELRGIVAMLTETVSQFSTVSNRSRNRLQTIEHRLEKVQAIEDVRLIKLQMADCLESLRAESEEQRKLWNDQIESLSTGLTAAQKSLTQSGGGAGSRGTALSNEDADPVTGLPDRRYAISSIGQTLANPANWFVIAFAVERVNSANLRYGYAVGDQMLSMWQQMLLSWFGDSAQLFRWSGPAMALMIESDMPLDQFRAKIAKMCGVRQEKTFHVGPRSVLMLIAASHLVLRISDFTSTDAIAKRIDSFIKDRASE